MPDCGLVSIDPVSAYNGRVDSHNNSDVRGMLAPLSAPMQSRRIACVCVTHLNKGAGGKAVYRAMGSLAFVAAARSMWSFSPDADDSSRMLMLPGKMNLTAQPTGLAYRIVTGEIAPAVVWEPNPVMMTANESLAAELKQQDGRGAQWREAAEFLSHELSQGPRHAGELTKLARAEGITDKPLRTAREKLDVQISWDGGGPGSKSVWSLPTSP